MSAESDAFPLTNAKTLSAHQKPITALAVDGKGDFAYSASTDGELLLWTLRNLSADARPVRSLRPFAQQNVVALAFNCTNAFLAVCGRAAAPKLLAREGRELFDFVKGDMYISDLTYTKGHVAACTHCLFHPFEANVCITSALDGTVRLWDINADKFGIERQLPCLVTLKCRDRRGQRAPVDSFLHNERRGAVIAFCADASMRVLEFRGGNATTEVGLASVTGACWTENGDTFAVRSGERLSVFDARKLGAALETLEDLPGGDDLYRCGVVELRSGGALLTTLGAKGSAAAVERGTLAIAELALGDGRATAIAKIGESEAVLIGCGQNVHILTANKETFATRKTVPFKNETISLSKEESASNSEIECQRVSDFHLFKQKHNYRRRIDGIEAPRPIYVPNALPMFRPDLHHRRARRFDKIRADDKLSKKPLEMLSGPGFGGEISGPRTTVQFVMKAIHQLDGPRKDVMQRVAEFAEAAKRGPKLVEDAYALTQPKPVLDYSEPDSMEARLMSLFNKCKFCGMKICQCNREKKAI